MQASSRPTERSEEEPGPIGPKIVWRGPVLILVYESVDLQRSHCGEKP
jgi:hypothetical protein